MLSAKAQKALEIALASKALGEEVSSAIDAGIEPAAAVADIADPSTATEEDCANKINELMASLRAAGLLAE